MLKKFELMGASQLDVFPDKPRPERRRTRTSFFSRRQPPQEAAGAGVQVAESVSVIAEPVSNPMMDVEAGKFDLNEQPPGLQVIAEGDGDTAAAQKVGACALKI